MHRCTVHSCANGLRTLIWRRAEVPVVSVQVWVETGSMYEGEYAGSGISHLLEHMVFKGTSEYSAADLNEEVSSLGGLWNAYTSTDRTVFHIEGPAEHWRSFLHILTQLTFHPTFPEEEWEREREVIRREMEMYRDDPESNSYAALVETLFKRHPRRFPVIGERAAFDALTSDDMRRYYEERYTPGNMFFCIVGDVDAPAVAAAVEEEVAGWEPRRTCALPPLPAEPRQWGPRVHRREFPQSTSSLMLAWRIPEVNHPDMAPLTLLSWILGQGRAAWLYREFHDDRALVHDIATMLLPHHGGEGAFVVDMDVDRAERDRVRDAILAYVEELSQADYAEGLRRAMRQLRVRHMKALSTVQGAADLLGGFWRHARNTHAYEEWRSALEQVSPADLQRVARDYLQPQRLAEVSVDPVGSLAAETDDEQASEKRPPRVTRFENGVRCITRVDRRAPMVYVTVAVAAGCRAEQVENAGVCTLMAECMPRGSASYSGEKIATLVENAGASLHSVAGNNTVLLSLRCLAEDAPTMLELLAEVALHPSFPEDAVQTAKEDMLVNIEEEEESPVGVAFRRLRALCFGDSSYGHLPSGTRESVASLSRASVQEMHARLFCGQNIVVSLVGDIDQESIEAQVHRLFSEAPAGECMRFCPTPPQRAGELSVPGPEQKEQAVLALAVPSLALDHEDLPLLMLLDEWCQDMAGPIYSEIREKQGMAYHASSGLLMGVDAGCLFFELETSPQLLPQARVALSAVLAELAEHGMPQEALERARATALSSRLLASQSAARLSSDMAVDEALGLGAEHSVRVLEALRHVSAEQMRAFMRRILAPEGVRSWVSVCPASQD